MKLTKKLWTLFIVLMCAVNVITIARFVATAEDEKYVIGENLASLTGEINAANSVTAAFEGNGKTLESMEIFFSTYNRKNQGELRCAIYSDDLVVYEALLDMSLLRDNQYHRIEEIETELAEGNTYHLELSSSIDATTDNGVTAWRDENNNLIASLYTEQTLSLWQMLAVNITYALVNYIFCLCLRLFRR